MPQAVMANSIALRNFYHRGGRERRGFCSARCLVGYPWSAKVFTVNSYKLSLRFALSGRVAAGSGELWVGSGVKSRSWGSGTQLNGILRDAGA